MNLHRVVAQVGGGAAEHPLDVSLLGLGEIVGERQISGGGDRVHGDVTEATRVLRSAESPRK